MAEFKKGDRVFVKPGMSSRYGWAPEDPATPLTVQRVEHDYRVFVRPPWDGVEYSFRPEDLTHAEPETPAPLDPFAARRESVPPFEATTNPDGSITARSNLRFTPAPLDPSGRHDLAADFFHAKTGTAASYFTVDLSPDERAPYYAAADAFLAAQPDAEPEPEYENGAVIRTAFSEYHMIAGEFVDIHDGGPLAGDPEVSALFVIDPAEVDVDMLVDTAHNNAMTKREVVEHVLSTLGIEVPR